LEQKMNKRILGAILFAVSGLTVASIASAANCRNVDLVADNKGSHLIKVKYANYKCEGENEKKESFNNVEVQPNQLKTVATNQDLAGCGGKKMQHIEYVYSVWCDGRWSSDRTIRDTSFLNAYCGSDTGKKYTIQIPTTTCD
jgi:hypothetical protein